MTRVVPLPSVQRLAELFSYDPAEGVLRWRPRPPGEFANAQSWRTWNTRFAGGRAGTVARRPGGLRYLRVAVTEDGVRSLYSAAMIAWALLHGDAPAFVRVLGEPTDLRPCQLEAVESASELRLQRRASRTGPSGVRGVSRGPKGGWAARGPGWRKWCRTLDEAVELRRAWEAHRLAAGGRAIPPNAPGGADG